MPLKYKFKSKDEVLAELLAHYAERDGAWVLDVEGAVDQVKADLSNVFQTFALFLTLNS